MKRNGFIFIVTLIVMSAVMVSAFYVLHLTKMQVMIAGTSKNKIQSYLFAETKINRILYDEKYSESILYTAIENYLKYPSGAIYKKAKFTLDEDDVEDNDTIKSINCRFYENENKKFMELTTGSTYLGNNYNLKAYGPIVEDIFEIGIPLLSNELDFKTLSKVISYYDKLENIDTEHIPSKIKVIESDNHSKIIFRNKSSTYNQLIKTRNEVDISENIGNEIFLIVRKNEFYSTEISMEKGSIEKTLALSGLMYVEGDIRISTDFVFNGILIIKDGNIIVDTPTKPKFKGLIITNSQPGFKDQIEMLYESTYIYRYGIYLPGFINPRIEVLKKV